MYVEAEITEETFDFYKSKCINIDDIDNYTTYCIFEKLAGWIEDEVPFYRVLKAEFYTSGVEDDFTVIQFRILDEDEEEFTPQFTEVESFVASSYYVDWYVMGGL
jgi:hypothetical protein